MIDYLIFAADIINIWHIIDTNNWKSPNAAYPDHIYINYLLSVPGAAIDIIDTFIIINISHLLQRLLYI
jgi:hypothetical protein